MNLNPCRHKTITRLPIVSIQSGERVVSRHNQQDLSTIGAEGDGRVTMHV